MAISRQSGGLKNNKNTRLESIIDSPEDLKAILKKGEYIKAYNRLYGRIRRKTVPANTMLADKLKDLRDEYYEKYDTAEADVQESILQEFIRKNDELLS